jgi:hypothetical protein
VLTPPTSHLLSFTATWLPTFALIIILKQYFMKNSAIKLLQAAMLCITILSLNACKKDKEDPFAGHDTYFKGTVGGNTIDFKSNFFYNEDGITAYEGIGKIGQEDAGITLTCSGPLTSQGGSEIPYVFNVDDFSDELDGSAILVLVYPKNVAASGLSYYQDCDNGNTINCQGSIKIGKIEKVGNQEYIKGSFTGTVYTRNPDPANCSYTQKQISIEFRVPNRKLFGDYPG